MTDWVTPATWTPAVLLASDLNTQLRNQLLHLKEWLNKLHFYADYTAVGNVGGGADDLMTATVPAGFIFTDKQILWFEMGGTFAANANAKTVIVVFGATSVQALPAVTTSGGSWSIRGEIHRVSSSSQILEFSVTTVNGGGGTGAGFNGRGTPAEALGGAVTFKATGESGGAATNDIVMRSFCWGLKGDYQP